MYLVKNKVLEFRMDSLQGRINFYGAIFTMDLVKFLTATKTLYALVLVCCLTVCTSNHYQLGKRHLSAGDHSLAIREFRLAAEEKDKTVEYRIRALSYLGDSYEQVSRIDSATLAYNRAIEIAISRIKEITDDYARLAASIHGLPPKSIVEQMGKMNELTLEELVLQQEVAKLQNKLRGL